MSTIDALAVRVADDAAARFAHFDHQRFAHFVVSATKMNETLPALGPGSVGLVEDLLLLAAEAVGTHKAGSAARPTLLGVLLGEIVPFQLVTASSTAAAATLLARAWNIGEGVLAGPAFVDPYLVAAFRTVAVDLKTLRGDVVAALERVLTVERAPSWSHFSTHVLDLSTVRPDFLPGTLHAAAPGLLCVHDRHEPEAAAVVAVERGGQSRIVGPSPCLGDPWDAAGLPDVDAGDGIVLVGEVAVRAPTLLRSYWSACLPRGFVCVSAVDSQRVWLLESDGSRP